MICHACHSQDSGTFAEDISYPHRINKTSACLFELISHNLMGKEPKDSHEDNFPDVWASGEFEGKSNQKNLTVSAEKGWCTLTTT